MSPLTAAGWLLVVLLGVVVLAATTLGVVAIVIAIRSMSGTNFNGITRHSDRTRAGSDAKPRPRTDTRVEDLSPLERDLRADNDDDYQNTYGARR